MSLFRNTSKQTSQRSIDCGWVRDGCVLVLQLSVRVGSNCWLAAALSVSMRVLSRGGLACLLVWLLVFCVIIL